MPEILNCQNLTELEEKGFTVLKNLVANDYLRQFESQIADLVSAQLAQLGLDPRHRDPFIDLFSAGEPFKNRFYKLLERLHLLALVSSQIGDALGQAGFFTGMGMKVPLVWPDIRADLPDVPQHLLPVHQDYASMQCRKAYRLWIPLRPSDEVSGTMCVYPGTHRRGPVSHDLSDPLHPRIRPTLYRKSDRVVFDLPAGNGVLMDPLIFHSSIPNRSSRTKFTLMIQIQDLATMIDPKDANYRAFSEALSARRAAEKADS